MAKRSTRPASPKDETPDSVRMASKEDIIATPASRRSVTKTGFGLIEAQVR